jgi:Ca2+-binding RTX toxin-like protein
MTTSNRKAAGPIPLDLDMLDGVTGGVSGNEYWTLSRPGEEGWKINAGLGNDTVISNNGSDVLSGGLGDDVLVGAGGENSMDGGAGDDTVYGGDSWELLDGSGGHDSLAGGGGNDTMKGGTGDDTLAGGAGNDVMIGGWGSDTFVIDANDWRTTDSVHGQQQGTAIGEWLSRHDHDQIHITNADWLQVQITFTSGGYSGEVGSDGVQKLKTNSAGTITIGDQTVTFRGIESIKVG